ncbi:MAG TPA: ABC transporter ATP-binding protein [Hyphomicrobiaceae bacterium]|nr:ABC transporter ATP-binding protein [Hyphomicrobiaceae bacterium]
MVRDLVKIYGTNRVVDRVSFTVGKGEFVGLLGPSGCGKTTTLRAIAGLEEADGGTISIDGASVSDKAVGLAVPPHVRDVGMVFQSYAVWPHMTVAENVAFPLKVKRQPTKVITDRVAWALGIVGLTELRDRQPSQLSGGQQQRVALARAIVGRPKALLFDEPLSNLDAKLRDQTRAEIRRLQKELGVAAVYVTHDQAEALSMADRVIVMSGGRIMQEGPPKELYRNPANRFVADFVGTASFLDVTVVPGRGYALKGGQVLAFDTDGSPNGPVQLMLRPEQIALWPPGHPTPAASEAIAGKVREAHFLGAFTEYVVDVAGGTVKVHAMEDVAPGAETLLVFARAAGRIIPV